jgi:hypothetical protein
MQFLTANAQNKLFCALAVHGLVLCTPELCGPLCLLYFNKIDLAMLAENCVIIPNAWGPTSQYLVQIKVIIVQ